MELTHIQCIFKVESFSLALFGESSRVYLKPFSGSRCRAAVNAPLLCAFIGAEQLNDGVMSAECRL